MIDIVTMIWVILFLLPLVDARCHYYPHKRLVPFELVQGIPGGLRDDGTFVAKAVFNWSYASPTYLYDTVENGVLGSLAANENTLTTLQTFYRRPEDHLERHVLENMERYYVTVRVRSICDPHHIITQAVYCLNLTASFHFTHEYTSAHAVLTTRGWAPNATLIMHPDVYRELEYIVRVNQSHFIRVTSNVTVYGGDEYGRCKGINATIGEPCHARLIVTIDRWYENIRHLEPLRLSYAMSQFSQFSCEPNASITFYKPDDFNVSRREPIMSNVDRRFDICEGSFTSDGNVTETRRDASVVQEHYISSDQIIATCTYRLFQDECARTPFAYVLGWFDYDFVHPFNVSQNKTLVSSYLYNFTNR